MTPAVGVFAKVFFSPSFFYLLLENPKTKKTQIIQNNPKIIPKIIK